MERAASLLESWHGYFGDRALRNTRKKRTDQRGLACRGPCRWQDDYGAARLVPAFERTPRQPSATISRLIAGGEGIHWPDLDEDISVESLPTADRARRRYRGRGWGARCMRNREMLRLTPISDTDFCRFFITMRKFAMSSCDTRAKGALAFADCIPPWHPPGAHTTASPSCPRPTPTALPATVRSWLAGAA